MNHAARRPVGANDDTTRMGPLVERERELAALDTVLERARGGAGGSILLEGSAGLGKSRLLVEGTARARERGMQVLRGRAHETERHYPFALALQLFEAPLAAANQKERDALLEGSAGLARELFNGVDPLHDERWARSPFSGLHGLYWAAVNFTTQRGPALVCVDDLHWSDEPSLRFLRYLAGRLEELPIALVLATRPPRPEGDNDALADLRTTIGAPRLELRPLDVAGVTDLVQVSVPRADGEFCAACAEVTAGNPFYVHELVLALAEEKVGPRAVSAGRMRELGSALIARAALSRLIRLGADAVALGRALAILGDNTPLQRAAALAQLKLDVTAAAADALVAEEVLSSASPLVFAHPLVQESVYQEIPLAQRGLAHLAAARLLFEEGAAPEHVAAQLFSAPASGDAWVVTALGTAARRASAHGAPGSAARYLQRALEEPLPQELRRDLLADLGEAEMAAGSAEAIDHLSLALELEHDSSRRARLQRLRGRALAASGQGQAAAATLENAIDELAEADQDQTYQLLADYLSTAVFEPVMRQRAFARVTPFLAPIPAGSSPAERSLLAALAMRSAQEAEPAGQTIELAETAWRDGALLDDHGPDGPGWLLTDWALALAEDYERAKAITAAAMDAARKVGSVHAFANASYFHGHSCFNQGLLGDAEADAEQAIEASRSGWRRYLVAAMVLKVNVQIERDELDGAEATLIAAEDLGHGAMLEVPWRMHARGLLEVARSRPGEALELFTQAGDLLTKRFHVEHTVLPWRIDAAHAAVAVGEPQRARELIEPALAIANRAGLAVLQGRSLRVLGLIERGERGIELLELSVTHLAGSQAQLEYAYALADLGASLRRAGRRSDSRALLRTAIDLAHLLGAKSLAKRTREELTATGARPRREVFTGVDSLTPSESRVGRMAAEGLTNAHIAQALFVTPKTIEFHLRHVYQKLEIPGREQLATALALSSPIQRSGTLTITPRVSGT